MSTEEPPVLDREAVAAVLSVKAKTVSQYLVESRPPGKYASHPFPKPDGYIGRGPWWRREREQEFRDWASSRPGRGRGGGRPRKKTATQA
jgi:hypothetical protein